MERRYNSGYLNNNSAPVCVTAPQINGEGTETLCMTFLYKKRKITAPKTKRFKRAFPFVLRGLAIFMYVDRVVKRFYNSLVF